MTYTNPKDLLRFNRFDVAAKHLMLRHAQSGYQTTFGLNVYAEHIKVWNGFKEYDNPDKNSLDSYVKEFFKINDSIKEKGYDPELPPVPVNKDGYLLNGAHRLASCILNGKNINYEETVSPNAGQEDCTSYFFRNQGMDTRICDSIAVEYAKLKENSFIVTLFPAATIQDNINDIRTIIMENGDVVHEKGVMLKGDGPLNLIRQMYDGEPWGGDFSNNFSGFALKEKYCFSPSPDSPVYAFLVEFDSVGKAHEVKRLIRDVYGISNHSVHINDTHEETLKLARVFFNDRSLHYLNSAVIQNYPRYNHLLGELKDWMAENKYDSDEVCVTASSVMSAFGMREGQDLDYLYGGNVVPMQGNPLISEHNKEIANYTVGKDEIMYNDNNHFYFNGVKFASIGVIHELKSKRSEPKDIRDIEIMEGMLKV